MKQKTLGGTFSLKSKGLHTGLDLTVTMGPAPVNHGYLICRTDLEGKPVLQCLAENVTETTRGTVLNVNGVKCSTIEHGMAALMAAGINNVWIEVNGPEFPILDGSAILYAQEIEKVGVVEQDADIVLGLYREDYFNKEAEEHNKAELIVMKNRHGNTGTIPVQWMPEYTTYTSLERYREEP